MPNNTWQPSGLPWSYGGAWGTPQWGTWGPGGNWQTGGGIIPNQPMTGGGNMDWREHWQTDPTGAMARFLGVMFPGNKAVSNQSLFYKQMQPMIEQWHEGVAPWMDFMDFLQQVAYPMMQQGWNTQSWQPGRFAPSLEYRI